jgi:hypothetical protein
VCGCLAGIAFLGFSAIVFVGSVIGDCGDAQSCGRKDDAAHILWIAPLSALVIFLLVRWFVDRMTDRR